MDEKRIADYFVVAGLTEDSIPLEEFSFDGSALKPDYDQPPITDITVIVRSLGETPPPGFLCIEHTPSGLPADLNHGSLRSPEVYLCYRRGRDKPPLVDIGVLYHGKERVMADSEVVLSTPYGKPANVNNSANQHTYVTYRRATDSAPCNELVVSDICVVVTSKGEIPPHAYCMIKKNLNKGMLGSDVFLCYKKSMNKPRHISYQPGTQFRYPEEDIPQFPLPDSVPLFCLPMGAALELWPAPAATPKPVFSTFVLTVSDAAEKIYGSAITFYERVEESQLKKEQKAWLDMDEDENANKDFTVNETKSICILSHWPFFDTFEKFLRFLHKMAHSGSHSVPLERYISHFLHEVPFPSPQRPRILIQLSAFDRIALAQPEDLPIPRRGACFRQLLLNMGPDGCLLLFLLACTEQKLLIHSLRPYVLTVTAEALVASTFPFKWQCPYIPLCPLGLSDVLNAPLPFLIGVDSRFFDMYDPPADVTCVDLDTNTISICEEKRNLLSVKLLPKKSARTLRNTLQALYEKMIYQSTQTDRSTNAVQDPDGAIDGDFKIRKKDLILELEIQEAFLKFTASIMKGYRAFLLPITKAPSIGATDPNSLFDLQGFLRSRDKAYVKFYSLLMKTQMFIRFIEERSFVSDMDSSLAFFDECTERADLDDSDTRLLELDESHQSERTVFVMPPEPVGTDPSTSFTYTKFCTLSSSLFGDPPPGIHKPLLNKSGAVPGSSSGGTLAPGSPMARRTKYEIKTSQKVAKKLAETPMLWARCLLNTVFSIWFIHLPSHVLVSPSKLSVLWSAYEVLVKLQKLRLHPADEVCYRVMMQLCGVYSQPVLAVKVLFEMKRHGVQPNAITYGFYNKAVLEAHWSSDMANHSRLLWNKLRNVITAAALFRRAGMRRRMSVMSVYSSADESDADRLSRTSVDSAQDTVLGLAGGVAGAPIVLCRNNGSQSDVGYSSMGENRPQRATSSSQKDLRTSSIAENEESKSHRRSASASAKCEARRLNGEQPALDFSESDQFRSRVGSIVKSSANRAGQIHAPGLHEKSVDSSAGVLMGSFSRGSVLNAQEANELKAALALKEPVKGATLPREKTLAGSAANTSATSSQAKNNQQNSLSATSLFRSASAKLSEIEANLIPAKSALTNHLQWVRSSIRRKLEVKPLSNSCQSLDCHSEINEMEVTMNEAYDDSFDVQQDEEEEEVEEVVPELPATEKPQSPSLGGTLSPLRVVLTHGDPLGALDQLQPEGPYDSKPMKGTTEVYSDRLAARNLFPLDLNMRLFADEDRCDGNGLEDNSMAPAASSASPFSRYSGARWSLRKPDFKVNLGAQVFENALQSFSSQNLNAKKAEILVGLNSLKSAATSVAKKLDGIKGAIGGVGTTPSKFGSGLLAGGDDRNSSMNTLTVEESGQETWSSWTTQWLRRASSSDLTSQGQGQSSSGTQSEWSYNESQNQSGMKGAPSLTSLSGHLDRLFNGVSRKSSSSPSSVAMEILMTSNCKCHNCQSLLYDEEIMAGWTPEDSNLNTTCQHCKKYTVPFLTITIKDWRKTPAAHHEASSGTEDSGDSQTNPQESEDSTNHEEEFNRKEKPQPLAAPLCCEPITVAYLSPLVLRKELENILEQEGDVCLTKGTFVDQHPILYWNLIWSFERVGLVSHVSGLCLSSSLGLHAPDVPEPEIHSSWNTADHRNVMIKTFWNNARLHDEMGPPLYALWQQQEEQQHSPLVSALVTENQPLPNSLLRQLVNRIQYNDLLGPIKLLCSEYMKRSSPQKRHGIYRELLFLSFVAIGRENIDQVAFDREYRFAYDRLDARYLPALGKADGPPSFASVFCRHFFRELQL